MFWSDFNINQTANANATVYIYNADFKPGSLRIKSPCKLVIQEDIIFDPDEGSNYYYQPSKSSKASDYTSRAFSLGFFAAIVLESNNVTIDLNGKTIKQSIRHNLLQRFFAIIETSSAPFIFGQGPNDFGPITGANNINIYNGTLGLSSHHGIHGNNNTGVKINNLVIKDYEVAAIALNNADDLLISNVTINNNKMIPVLGILSAAIFLRHKLENILTMSLAPATTADLLLKFNALDTSIRDAVTSILTYGEITTAYPNSQVYKNISKIADGNNYGILVNNKGVAVNGYLEHFNNNEKANNITIKNIIIEDITNSIREILALKKSNGNIVLGTFGETFDFVKAFDLTTGSYIGNPVSNAQIALVRWSSPNIVDRDIILGNLYDHGGLGTLNIPAEFAALLYPSVTVNGITNVSKLDHIFANAKLKWCPNGDSMFHVNKGIIGIRFDGVNNGNIDNVTISYIKNLAALAIQAERYIIYKTENTVKNSNADYNTQDAFGFLFSSSKIVNLENSKIVSITSTNGKVYGVDIKYDSNYINICNLNNSYTIRGNPTYPSCNNKISFEEAAKEYRSKVCHGNYKKCPFMEHMLNC